MEYESVAVKHTGSFLANLTAETKQIWNERLSCEASCHITNLILVRAVVFKVTPSPSTITRRIALVLDPDSYTAVYESFGDDVYSFVIKQCIVVNEVAHLAWKREEIEEFRL